MQLRSTAQITSDSKVQGIEGQKGKAIKGEKLDEEEQLQGTGTLVDSSNVRVVQIYSQTTELTTLKIGDANFKHQTYKYAY